jgi:hypothetical protein
MSSPLGCHLRGRIPLSRYPPCQGRQVGECAGALLLMLFKLSQVVGRAASGPTSKPDTAKSRVLLNRPGKMNLCAAYRTSSRGSKLGARDSDWQSLQGMATARSAAAAGAASVVCSEMLEMGRREHRVSLASSSMPLILTLEALVVPRDPTRAAGRD